MAPHTGQMTRGKVAELTEECTAVGVDALGSLASL